MKSLNKEREKLEKQLLDKNKKLLVLRSNTKQSIDAKFTNLMEITDTLTNYTIKKENNTKDIDEVDAQMRLLEQKKACLVNEKKSINTKITKL